MSGRGIRLFVAVYPPLDVAAEFVRLASEVAQARGLPDHRLTTPEQVHVTVQFIGDTPVRELDRVRESVARSVSGLAAWTLTPQRLRVLPTEQRPRLVAVETDLPPDLAELKQRLVTRLARNARRRGGDRFLPHLTVLRFRGAPAGIAAWDEPLAGAGFPCTEVRLMRSTLHPDGARHEEIESRALAG